MNTGLYSISEFAEKVGLSEATLRNWHKNGTFIPAMISAGNHRYYSHEQFLKLTNKTQYQANQSILDDSNVLITGSGSLATQAIRSLKDRVKKLIIFSRDEHKHAKLRATFPDIKNIRFIIGDILDKDRLLTAMAGIDIVLHTAALKMIETGFYSPDAVVKVNTVGTLNVAEASIANKVKVALFISSDKATNAMNGLTYGLSKALAEATWLSYNNSETSTKLCVTRYGNIINSNNSFYHIIKKQIESGQIKITDPNMTRFYLTIQDAMNLNIHAVENTLGGEIFVPNLKSASIQDFVEAFAPNTPIITTGIRGVEKLAEELIAEYEMPNTHQSGNYFKIVPSNIASWDPDRPQEKPIVPFKYTSDSKDVPRLSTEELKNMVQDDQ